MTMNNWTISTTVAISMAFAMSGCTGTRSAGTLREAAVPSWVDQPSEIQSDGTIRTNGHSDAWLQSDSTRKAAQLDAERTIAKVLGGSRLWADTLGFTRDHPVLDAAALELGLGEKYLRATTYEITDARIASVVHAQCWHDLYGQRGEPKGYVCQAFAPASKALAALLDAKANGLKRRVAELREKRELSDQTEAKAGKAVELLIDRARELESRDDAAAR